MEQPLISIIMSVYNGEKYVLKTIQSVLRQEYKNFEFIIIDDCSTDSSLQILNQVIDSRVIIIHNETNLKLAASLNIGLQMARGEYIARIDADDICTKKRFIKQIEFLERHKDISILGGNYWAFGGSRGRSHYPQEHEWIETGLLFENTMCHPTVIFRKNMIEQRYDETFAASQDYDLWTRLIGTNRFHNLPDIVLLYRVHSGQTYMVAANEQKEGANISRKRMISKLDIMEDDADIFIAFCNRPTDITLDEFIKYCNFLEVIGEKNKDRLHQRAYQYYANKTIWRCVHENIGLENGSRILKYALLHYGRYLFRDRHMGCLIIRNIFVHLKK